MFIDIIPADPAGNKTIFVMSPVRRVCYQQVASFLMSLEEYEAEQVAFVLEDGSMEMAGLEFCGNASRTFGLIRAKAMGLSGLCSVQVSVSGCAYPLTVSVDTESDYTRIEMPVPVDIMAFGDDVLVDLDGIMHLVTFGREASANVFQRLKARIMAEFDPPALGVMFYKPEDCSLTPVVYVKDVDSTFFEGSCGSGSVAVACALMADEADGSRSFTISQPAGQLIVKIEKRQNSIESVSIEGPVKLGEAVKLKLPPELQI